MKAAFEVVLAASVAHAVQGAPPTLARALEYAVFPGGARVRPHLCTAVAEACGNHAPALTAATAAALELVHCASLVHDDLPCFDDAGMRRGRPSVHRAFGESTAVLVGDGLIVLAFETLARAAQALPERLPPLVATLAAAVGSPAGLVAGQAWESERDPPIAAYHRAKTGSLFVAATVSGAIAAGRDPSPWRLTGERLGLAYQVADDLLDALAAAEDAGKPVGRDAALARPNAVLSLGVQGAVARLSALVEQAALAVPDCRSAAELRALIRSMALHLVPEGIRQSAA